MCFRALFAPAALLLLLATGAVAGETIHGLPLHTARPSENCLRLWVGDAVSSTAVCALNTDRGIVVIDATESPTLDERFRAVIAREFGRDDFAYLINTHEHGDHTTGNGVYSDCEIIAHENCAKGMAERASDTARRIDWNKSRLPELEAELAAAESGSDEHQRIREQILVNKMVLQSLEAGLEPTLPTRTFSDTMTLDMGNMTLELYAMGGTHTASDLFVFVPEEGLLFTGDMMADEWFTDTPGCLQAFSMRPGVDRDVPMVLRHWKSLLARKDEIRDYVPGHWNGDLSHEGFAARCAYLETMYNGVGRAASVGQTLETVLADFDPEVRFPELFGTPGFTQRWVHYGSVLALWSDETGQTSASEALAAAIEEEDAPAAATEILAERGKADGKYYFLEPEFNRLGYRYLGEEKVGAAIAVFQANVQLYPDSWNAYDSLGEAYLRNGQTDLAVRNYETSMQLNPDNENGKNMLEEIRRTVPGS